MELRRSMVTDTGDPESTYYVYVNMARHEGSAHSHFLARQTNNCTASLVKAFATLQNGSTVIVAPGTYCFVDSALVKGSNIKVVCLHGSAVFHGVGCIPLITVGPQPYVPKLTNVTITAESEATYDTLLGWIETPHFIYKDWIRMRPNDLKYGPQQQTLTAWAERRERA